MNYKNFRIVPFLVLLYFFIHYVLDYFYFLDVAPTLLTTAKYFLVTGILYFIGYKLFKKKEKFTLVFSTMLFLFLFFGAIMDTLADYNVFQRISGVYLKYCLGYLAAGIVVVALTAWAGQNIIRKFLRAWMIYCLVVTGYDVVTFALREKKDRKYMQAGERIHINPDAPRPHVFFLLFDMYTSDAIYRKYLEFDNSAIHNFLSEKGFYVTRNAHSLYDFTHLSLSSTLNMESLAYINDSTLPQAKRALLSLKRGENSSLVRAFKEAGYKINNFSFFNLQGNRSPLYFNLEDHLTSLITGTTLFNRVYNGIDVDVLRINKNIDLRFIKNSWSEDTKNDLDYLNNSFDKNLAACKNSKAPTFNYFHFMVPHSPFIFDSAGNELSLKEKYTRIGFDPSVKRFDDFTKYGNNRIRDMVDKIFRELGNNAVIIIQGDHGYREFEDSLPEAVRFGIFNSVYLPIK